MSSLTWHRPSPQNKFVASAFYRDGDGAGHHAFLYEEGGEVLIRTRDAGLRDSRTDRRPDLKAAKRLVERRAARGAS